MGISKRGFASFPQDKLRSVASKAGRMAHEKGRAHTWSHEEARMAGKKAEATER